jgi:hypothetical protein
MFEALLLESDPTVGVVATLSLGLSVCVLIGSARFGRVLGTFDRRSPKPGGRGRSDGPDE